ncbi:MAG: preprotein translocase subunit SecG [Gammaproteobacteria bacterium 39-13]|nr:preprotein translocase subunit SecG [Gammaproteobacteria bacterium]OJV91414.1 MAG: preprotein translocase subunit SecG [Gammaproteobacteria bacterium 39-13]
MYVILLAVHVIISLMLIGLILIQHGKGAQTGAAFGSGASQTVFGSQGSGGFLSRATATLAVLFFVLNLFLVFYLNRTSHRGMPMEAPATANETKGLPEGKDNKKETGAPAGTDVPAID